MRLPITLHKNYTLNEDGYQLKLPLNLETIIPEDDSVRLLSQFVTWAWRADWWAWTVACGRRWRIWVRIDVNDSRVYVLSKRIFKKRGCRTKKLVRSSFSAQKVTAGLRKARLLV